MTKTKMSPARFAAQLVDGMGPENLGDLIEAHDQHDVWERLAGAVRAAHRKSGNLPNDIEDQILAALPEKVRQLFVRFSDDHGIEIMIAQECGFLVGLELGRRRAGGAR